MDAGRLFEKTRWWTKLLFFIPLTLFLFLFAFLLSPSMTEGFVECEGVITKVEKVYDEDFDGARTVNYETTFTYTVDGKTYEGSFSLGDERAVGDTITLYYNPKNPENISNTLNNEWLWIIFLVLGCAAAIFTVVSAVNGLKRQKQTDALRSKQNNPQGGYRPEEIDLSALTEYYFRFDGRTFMPGYLIEDRNRVMLFEGKMKNNYIVVPRTFTFTNGRSHVSTEHKVSHVVTSGSEDYGVFSTSSYFKFDGENIWDYLHKKGLLINTGMSDSLGQMVYDLTLNGQFLARAVMTSIYVHEEDEKDKKIKIPNKMYYRIWTNATDLELIFTAIFAIAETDQLIYS